MTEKLPEKATLPPMPNAPPRQVEPIKVRELRFDRDRSVPLVGSDYDTRRILAGRQQRSANIVEMQYEPWQRMYRVRELSEALYNAGATVVSEFCLPESWALYVPERS